MKILFVGCVESSNKLLEKLLIENKHVVGVITKMSSRFNSDFRDLKPLCDKYNIPCQYVDNVNEEDSIAFIKKMSPDVGFCFGWSQLVKDEVISLFPKGMIGFHPAELPRNRGRHPIIWALVLGLNQTASSFFMMDAEADNGDIISQERITIDYEDDAGSLYDKVMEVAVQQEVTIVDALERGALKTVKQEGTGWNSWRKRNKNDGLIDWRMSSKNIYNLVRALTHPYVGAHFVFDDKEYKVWRTKEVSAEGQENIEPGKVLSVNRNYMDVKTGDGAIRLLDFEEIDIKEGEYLL
ncbi:MAG: methionyl-tRNA formyltransferase [Lachnospiraceae bacterium]|nr:methionyl-tRNA formyltransferase [Lachnospiraceae bacterium]